MPTWNEFAWSAFLYGSLGGDPYYDSLMGNSAFINSLHTNPSALTPALIRDNLIRFLNQWKTRIDKSCSASLYRAICSTHPLVSAMSSVDLTTIPFAGTLTVNGSTMNYSAAVVTCYDRISAVNGVGPTATAKILHILSPNLFVMWDAPILAHFQAINPAIGPTGSGYASYLQEAQNIANQVTTAFSNATHTPAPQPRDTSAVYLSRHLQSKTPKSLAKYVDEYLWVTITNGTVIPPAWWPQMGELS